MRRRRGHPRRPGPTRGPLVDIVVDVDDGDDARHLADDHRHHGGAERVFDRVPSEGPVGTIINVSGTACEGGQGRVSLRAADRSEFPTNGTFPVAADGSWRGQLTVPQGTDPDIEYVLDANCVTDDVVFSEYGTLPFDVLAGTPTAVVRTG